MASTAKSGDYECKKYTRAGKICGKLHANFLDWSNCSHGDPITNFKPSKTVYSVGKDPVVNNLAKHWKKTPKKRAP